MRFSLLAWTVLALLFCRSVLFADTVHVVCDLDAYRQEYRNDPSHEMVDLQKAVPGLSYDLRYATANNFLGHPLYPAPRAFLRRAAALRLQEVEEELHKQGLGLKIFDAYRPYSVSAEMWKERGKQSPQYLAPPNLGSDHNRGVAIDVTLIDLDTGEALSMPTDFDAFTPRAYRSYTKLPEPVLEHRYLLESVMERHGFHGIDSEWWHYSLNDAPDFSVLDLSFSDLEK